MKIDKIERTNHKSIKFFVMDGGIEVGRATLYLVENDLHNKPYGLLEDVFVDESARSKGIGTELVIKVIKEAKAQKCHKLIGTSRFTRENVHKWYEKLGFDKHGYEFRMDLK